ncbi:hypothetical protein D3C76_381770 [compost metagenome]
MLELVAALGIGGEHARLLVEHFVGGETGQAGERAVDLDDVAGRVGDHDRRRGVFEDRGGHAHLALRTALLADVAGHAEQSFEAPQLIPHQGDAQFQRHLAPVGAQAVDMEQVRPAGVAQFGSQLRIADGGARLAEQGVQPVELRRIGDDLLEAVLHRPFRAVAEVLLQRRADVVEIQPAVGGEDHVADAFRQQSVAAIALVQRLVSFDGFGDVLDGHQNPGHAPVGVAPEGLLAEVEPMPAAVAVAPAGLAFQQQVVAHHLAQVAKAPPVLPLVGVDQFFPVLLAHLLDFGAAVAELAAQAVVAEQHLLADQVLDIEGVRHRLHHFRPEALALQQGKLHLLALGDVGEAEGDRGELLAVVRDAQLQPDMAPFALRRADHGFRADRATALQHGGDDLGAYAAGAHAGAADQLLPGLFGRGDAKQLAGDAVDFDEADFAQQPFLPLRFRGQPGLQVVGVVQALFQQAFPQIGEVDHAERDAGVLEGFPIAPAGLFGEPAALRLDAG